MKAPELTRRADQLVWDTKYFSERDREFLKGQGCITLNLHGKSIAELLKEFPNRWLPLPDTYGLEEAKSRNSEVAFNPDNFYLEDSGKYTLEQQKRMVDELSKKLADQGLNSTMVIGGIADYSELVLRYFRSHRKILGVIIRSSTPAWDEFVFNLTVFRDHSGPLLDIREWQRPTPVRDPNVIDFDTRKPGIGIAPLIFPS